MSGLAPRTDTFTEAVPALGAAVSDVTTIFEAPYACSVSSVSYVPDAAITGAATNSRTFNVHNRGQAGAGTTLVATLAMVNAVNAVQYDERALTLQVTANLVLVQGDIVTWESLSVGTGIADPGGTVIIEVTRT